MDAPLFDSCSSRQLHQRSLMYLAQCQARLEGEKQADKKKMSGGRRWRGRWRDLKGVGSPQGSWGLGLMLLQG